MNLSLEDWKNQLENDENAIILDVRTPEEFQNGYIPGAYNIDIYQGQGFIYNIEALDKTKNYYVYCQAGMRSAKACEIMNSLDIKNTYNLSGGIMNWPGEII